MNNYIDKKRISNIIEHHEKIFGIKEDLKRGSYLAKKDAIFSLYNMFCLLDDTFISGLNKKFSYDILAIILFYNEIIIEDIDEQIKNKLMTIIDTKLYYFDQLLCYRANNSIEIKNYLRSKHIYVLQSTEHFLKVSKKKFKEIVHAEFLLENLKLKANYNPEAIDFILSIPGLNKQSQITDPVLGRLIKSKNKIALFRDMADDDIKNLLFILKFTIYQAGEIIIYEGESSTDVFFILSGECEATIHKSSVGTLKKNQIFGEFAFLLQQPRSATIRATKETVIIKFKFDEDLFHKYPFSFSMLYKNITEELILKIINMNKLKSV